MLATLNWLKRPSSKIVRAVGETYRNSLRFNVIKTSLCYDGTSESIEGDREVLDGALSTSF